MIGEVISSCPQGDVTKIVQIKIIDHRVSNVNKFDIKSEMYLRKIEQNP